MRPAAFPPSPASPHGISLDASDDTSGTKAVPRGGHRGITVARFVPQSDAQIVHGYPLGA